MLKQVIVMRNDLNMRKGKMIAQGAHAAIDALLFGSGDSPSEIEERCQKWLETGMTKICVRCNSEEELMDIRDKAKAFGLAVGLIRDAGHTEFNEPTYTCLAIGPNEAEEIDKITGTLELL